MSFLRHRCVFVHCVGLHQIGISHMIENILPTLDSDDLVVVVLGAHENICAETSALCERVRQHGARVAVFVVVAPGETAPTLSGAALTSSVHLSQQDLLLGTAALSDFALKMALNVVSSGMQVSCG